MSTSKILDDIVDRCRAGLVTAGAFSLVINLLMLTTSVYMLQVYDRVLTGHSIPTLIYLSAIALAALAVMALLELMRSRILVRIGIWLDQRLSAAVFSRGIGNTLRGIPYRSEALRDLGAVRSFLGGAGIMALFDAPWMPIYLAFVFLLHPLLGLVALAGAVVLLALALINSGLTVGPLKRANAASARGLQAADFAFRNAEVIDGMGMGRTLAQRWSRVNAEVLWLQAIASDRAGVISSLTKFVRLGLQIGILGVGAWLALQQEISAGAMVAASIIMGRALAPVEQAIATWKQTAGAREAWHRLNQLFAAPLLRPSRMQLPRPTGRLAVEGVRYAPPGATAHVLKGLSFAVEPGTGLALIGPSAAGKSTLARLLVGLAEPQGGTVRLDSADVFAWNRDDFGRHVGYLPQDVELFPGTIGENISRMEEESDPEEIIAAAQMAGVHEMILRLANGYETQIGEGGAMLSGGQRQRIGLARALYRRPVLVVLDEPNASLDAAGEQALNAAISAMKEAGSTVVVIAHRPSLMAHIDVVAVMNDGQLTMFGPRDAVLAQLARPPAGPATQPPVRILNSQGAA